MTTGSNPLDRETFERERAEHNRDHDREHEVASKTAERLEREVEETARRLERGVDEVAGRIEKAVETALIAVAATAKVHAEAHHQEHVAHERIHDVEKMQVDKAETAMNKRLEGMNEFRQALTDQSVRTVTRELFESNLKEVNTVITLRTTANSDRIAVLERQAAARAGKSEGLSLTAKIVVGAAALIATTITIISTVLALNG